MCRTMLQRAASTGITVAKSFGNFAKFMMQVIYPYRDRRLKTKRRMSLTCALLLSIVLHSFQLEFYDQSDRVMIDMENRIRHLESTFNFHFISLFETQLIDYKIFSLIFTID